MNSGEAPSATVWMRAASGLEVLTGLGLVAAPSLWPGFSLVPT